MAGGGGDVKRRSVFLNSSNKACVVLPNLSYNVSAVSFNRSCPVIQCINIANTHPSLPSQVPVSKLSSVKVSKDTPRVYVWTTDCG